MLESTKLQQLWYLLFSKQMSSQQGRGVEPGCLDGIENVDIPPAKQDSCPDHSTGIQARKLPFGCAERFQISSISREIWQEFLVLDFVSDAITFGPFYATFGWC